MRSKILIVCITMAMLLSLTACEESGTMSVTTEGAAQEQTEAAAVEEAEAEYDDYEIPATVLNLTEEEDLLLTGTLKDGVYTNEYFGYRFTVPEGWSIYSMNGEAEGEPLKRFSETYEDGMLGILICGSTQESTDNTSVSVSDLAEDEIGKTEEELLQPYLETDLALNEESNAHIETVTLAGEEHPAIVDTIKGEDGTESTSVMIILPKDGFYFLISLYAHDLPLEELEKCIQKI